MWYMGGGGVGGGGGGGGGYCKHKIRSENMESSSNIL